MTTTTATAQHLRTIATTWGDLEDALGAATQAGWPPVSLRSYLAGLDQADIEEAAALRAMERSPDQIGQRPIPIRLDITDTMRLVTAALAECADQIAPTVTRPPIPMPAPRRAAVARTRAERKVWADHARRVDVAQADAADVRRWRYTGAPVTGPYAALWLCARVEHRPGPFRPLGETQLRHIAIVASGALQRIERALDTCDRTAQLARPCPCGGQLTVYGGAGQAPAANCDQCGHTWTARDTMTAA